MMACPKVYAVSLRNHLVLIEGVREFIGYQGST